MKIRNKDMHDIINMTIYIYMHIYNVMHILISYFH